MEIPDSFEGYEQLVSDEPNESNGQCQPQSNLEQTQLVEEDYWTYRRRDLGGTIPVGPLCAN